MKRLVLFSKNKSEKHIYDILSIMHQSVIFSYEW